MKAKACSDADHEEIEKHSGNLLIHYDHVITSYEKNYNVAASTVLDKNICCYTADDSVDTGDVEKHIKKMIAQGGYSNFSIKVFDKLDVYCARLDQLEKLRADKNIDPKAIESAKRNAEAAGVGAQIASIPSRIRRRVSGRGVFQPFA